MKPDVKRKTMRRLKIVEGQVRGLQKMVSSERYCIHILRQSSAVKEALSGIEDLILEHHLATHAAAQMRAGKTAKAVKEILTIYRSSRKK